jgi:chemotaxis signal transduction protein
VPGFESGRRLCLLFESAAVRFAIEATSVMEIAQPDPTADRVRGNLELRDLSDMLSGLKEVRPGMAVVLDVSPTIAVRVKSVIEVVDVARDPLFQLPQLLGEHLGALVRAALLHGPQLFLELTPESLPHLSAPLPAIAPRPIYLVEETPDRALLFESHGRVYGIALTLVSQVVPCTRAFCGLPGIPGPMAGLFPHAQVLWPVFTARGLLGEPSGPEELLLLTELAGQSLGLSASKVLGVQAGFTPTDVRGEFALPGFASPVLFLDFQRMFS